jgi:hypothetical protein
VGGSKPSRSTSAWSEVIPVIPTGRLCGTSASRAPSVITMRTPRSRAVVMTSSVKRRQWSEGSTPWSITRSPSAPGTGATQNEFSGHSISRMLPSVSFTVGRTAVKS